MVNPNQQAADSVSRAAFDTFSSRLDPNTKRMAGAALAAMMTPGMLSAVDNQEESLLGQFGSGAVTLGGTALGAAVGLDDGRLSDEMKELYIETEIDELKRKSKNIAREKGAQAGAEYFGKAKQKLLESVEPILNPVQAKNLNYFFARHGFGELNTLGLGSMTPRELRYMGRGAGLGALASIPLAYQALRGGEIE